MKKLLVIVVLSLLFSNVAYSGTYAVKIKEFGIADMTIKMKEFGIADETWKIKGSCRSAVSYTTIKIKEFGIADKTVKVKTYGIADKDICIKNPNDAPNWLLEMLN
jgi:Uri superfamily endonuclease